MATKLIISWLVDKSVLKNLPKNLFFNILVILSLEIILIMLPAFIEIEFIAQKMVLESKLKSVDTVDALLSHVRHELAITDENFNDIWVVLNEAVSNAVKHGNRYNPYKKVRLTVEVKGERFLCFTVKDEGAGFDADAVPDPTSPERIHEPNGRGIFLMKKLAHDVNYYKGGTEVEVSFDLYKN